MKRSALPAIVILASFTAFAVGKPPPPVDLLAVGFTPSITAQPQNQTVIAGQSATFTVTAMDSENRPLSYGWTFNGLNVDSNSSSYARSNCELADGGGRVRVTVSNGSGSVQSSTATLTVNPTGTNYHVATNGSSSNTGLSTDSPWSLAYGITKLGPGITLMLMPGVYTGPVLIYNVTGSAANPATIRSMYKWQAIIANSPNRGVELYNNIKQPSYVVLDGLCVSNSAHVGMKLMDPNCTVRNCWITHNGNNLDTGEPGIDTTDTGGGGNVFEYNLIEYNGCAANGGHGHGIYFSGTNNIVRGNVLRYNQGFGIHLYTEADGTWNNDNYIYNNLTYGHTNKYGVTLWSANGISGALPGTNYLFGNTILDGVSLSYGGVCVTNNIILPTVINLTRPIYSGSHPPIFIGADYNLGTNTITPAGAHDVITNFVGLVKQDYGLYWLKSDSLARGHALSTAYGPVDFFGNAQFLVLDIGAFQYDDTLAGDSRVLDPSPANPDYWSLP